MEQESRKTGIDVIGDVPWGTHFCQFYQTAADLTDILVPYFKAGLENNEFCMWVTSQPLGVDEAKTALGKVVRNLDDYIEKGQIEILDAGEWYTKSATLEPGTVLQGWVEKENQALERGFDGLRLSGNTFWLESTDWKDFTDYEATVDRVIGSHRMIGVCSYLLDKCGAPEIVDVVSNHGCALFKSEGKWIIIQSSERKRMREAMSIADDKFWKAFHANPDIMIICTLKDERIIEVNDSFLSATGYRREELIGRTLTELGTWPKPKEHARYMRMLEKEGKVRYAEMKFCTKTGEIRIALGSAEKIYTDHERCILFALQDITERKRAEEALKETNQTLKALIQASPLAIIALDPHRNVTMWNPSAERLFGWTEQEVLGRPNPIVPEDKQDEYHKVSGEALAGGALIDVERIRQKKDGSLIDVTLSTAPLRDAKGNITGTIAMFTDITRRKRVEEVLKRSNEFLRTVLDSTNDAISVIDVHDYRIVAVNNAFLKQLGVKEERVVGQKCYEVTHHRSDPCTPPDDICPLVDAVRSGALSVAEHVHYRREGEKLYVEVSASPIRDASGNIVQVVHVARDITGYRRVGEERETISRLGAIITSSLDIQQVYQEFAAQLKKLVGFDRAIITLLDESQQGVRTFATSEVAGDDLQVGEGIPLKGTALEWLVANKKPHLIKDREQEQPFSRDAMHLERGLRSSLRVPLISQGKVIGAFNLHSRSPNAYGEREVQILSQVAAQLAVAIANAQLFEEQKHRTEEMSALQELGQAVIGSLDMEAVSSLALEVTLEVLGLDAGTIRYLDEETQELVLLSDQGLSPEHAQVIHAHARVKLGYSMPGIAAQSGEPLIIEDVPHDPRVAYPSTRRSFHSAVNLPLKVKGRVVGVIAGFSRRRRTFTPAEMEMMASLGNMMGMAIANAQLFQQVQAAEREWEQTFEGMSDGVSIQSPDFRILRANGALARLLGTTPEALVGQPCYRVMHGMEQPLPECPVAHCLEERKTCSLVRQEPVLGGRWLDIQADPILDREGNVVSVVHVVTDITELKQAEEERKGLEAQILQLAKMEAVGRLAGGVAHDFNNLLTVITGYSELLLLRLGEDDPLAAEVGEIKRAGERAASLTRQLLTFSRRQRVEARILNPNDVVASMEELLRRLISDDIELVTVLHPRLESVKADPVQIEQVIMNLAINAQEAMPEGGRLTIKTENVTLGKRRSGFIPEARPGRFVCLSVEDTGVGMGEETLEHIFEPFFSTKEAGSGLGLSVAYGIVKQHEGWIDVSSKPGQGSTFRVYLPAVPVEAEVEAEGTVPSAEFRGRGQRILLVEDEPGVRAVASKVLGDNGYAVFEAADAEEALAIFEREKGRFHLVFSDVVLPDKDGLQLADELLSRHPGLPVLMSSGYSDQKAHWPIIKKRKFPFLQKPWALADMLRSVKKAMAQTKEHGHR